MCSTLPGFSQGINKKWQDYPSILFLEKCARKGFNFAQYRIRHPMQHLPEILPHALLLLIIFLNSKQKAPISFYRYWGFHVVIITIS